MSIFDPENREKFEAYKESRELSKKTEASVAKAIAQGKEKFPDIITCPNRSCQNPLKTKVTEKK